VTEWDRWQTGKLKEIVAAAGDRPICGDENQQLYEVDAGTGISLVGEGPMAITRSAFTCAGLTVPLDQIDKLVTVDRMTMLFALKGGKQYEVRSAVPRSVLKYMEILKILKEG
ncbi:MAG: hypothetical protein FWE80_05105, partial [Oscillospiraceae bacterium]|nr:hypothetical protein [Oscillospiraceae bacterium]